MRRIGLATVAWAGCGLAAQAQEPPKLLFSLGAATEYVFRGVGQTDGQPQVFGGADLTHRSVYLGAWVSNVNYGDGTDAELDLYGGVRRELVGWTVDAGAVAYLYPGQPESAAYDYVETKLAVSRSFGPATLGAAAFWTPDFGGGAQSGTYAELNAAWVATAGWSISGAVGHQALSRSDADYATWNLGLSWNLNERVTLDWRMHDTDAEALGPAYDARVTAGLRAAF